MNGIGSSVLSIQHLEQKRMWYGTEKIAFGRGSNQSALAQICVWIYACSFQTMTIQIGRHSADTTRATWKIVSNFCSTLRFFLAIGFTRCAEFSIFISPFFYFSHSNNLYIQSFVGFLSSIVLPSMTHIAVYIAYQPRCAMLSPNHTFRLRTHTRRQREKKQQTFGKIQKRKGIEKPEPYVPS